MAFLQTAVQAAHHFQASYKPNTGELHVKRDWLARSLQAGGDDKADCLSDIAHCLHSRH